MVFRKESSKSNKYIGSVTDGKLKLTVFAYSNLQIDMIKGMKYNIIGQMSVLDEKIMFEISRPSDIIKIEGVSLCESVLNNINRTPKRSAIGDSLSDSSTFKKV